MEQALDQSMIISQSKVILWLASLASWQDMSVAYKPDALSSLNVPVELQYDFFLYTFLSLSFTPIGEAAHAETTSVTDPHPPHY